jgi:hypothetical protein
MSVASTNELDVMSIEECQRLGPPLRRELEVLDYEIRRLVARARADARLAGSEDSLFVKASSTVMLSIAAELMARAAEEGRLRFDVTSFAAGADRAAQWARGRRLKYFLAGEA